VLERHIATDVCFSLQLNLSSRRLCFTDKALSSFELVSLLLCPVAYFMTKTVHATRLTKQIASLVSSLQLARLENTKFPDPHSLVELNYYIINVN